MYPGDKFRNYVRYCEYPGERIIDHIGFVHNGNLIESYSYYRNISYRENTKLYNIQCGNNDTYQMPKYKQKELNMIIPLHFYFNDDDKYIDAFSPKDIHQHIIELNTCNADNLIFESPSCEIHIYGKVFPFYQINGVEVMVKNLSLYKQCLSIEPSIYYEQSKQSIEFPVELYKYGTTPVHSDNKSREGVAHLKYLCNNYKSIKISIQDKFNVTHPVSNPPIQQLDLSNPKDLEIIKNGIGNWNMWRDWHRMGFIDENGKCAPIVKSFSFTEKDVNIIPFINPRLILNEDCETYTLNADCMPINNKIDMSYRLMDNFNNTYGFNVIYEQTYINYIYQSDSNFMSRYIVD